MRYDWNVVGKNPIFPTSQFPSPLIRKSYLKFWMCQDIFITYTKYLIFLLYVLKIQITQNRSRKCARLSFVDLPVPLACLMPVSLYIFSPNPLRCWDHCSAIHLNLWSYINFEKNVRILEGYLIHHAAVHWKRYN